MTTTLVLISYSIYNFLYSIRFLHACNYAVCLLSTIPHTHTYVLSMIVWKYSCADLQSAHMKVSWLRCARVGRWMQLASEPAPLWKTQRERLLIALVWRCWWSVFFPSILLCSPPVSPHALHLSLWTASCPSLCLGLRSAALLAVFLSLLLSLSIFSFLSFSPYLKSSSFTPSLSVYPPRVALILLHLFLTSPSPSVFSFVSCLVALLFFSTCLFHSAALWCNCPHSSFVPTHTQHKTVCFSSPHLSPPLIMCLCVRAYR